MNVLNGSAYRRHNPKITYQQICNWFSNQRAANRSSPRNSNNSTASQPLTVTTIQTSVTNDYRPKFDFNSLLENKQLNGLNGDEYQRIDGGSDSPTPNDDGSIHSGSDSGFNHDLSVKQLAIVGKCGIPMFLDGSEEIVMVIGTVPPV
ncbi:hypothetical protein AB6A40_009446 [Gnathostoma spinigerum]|uniref:Homeobox domain-containing protein n=1 Tax=Gnathostoma spinigerum TaxID=75299 RepID=A0ABD6EUE8_9BILA